MIIAFFLPFVGNMRWTNESFLELICFRLVQWNPDFIIFKTQNSKFHDFLVFEPVTKPQNQHYLSLETPRHLNKIKKQPWNNFEKYYVCNSESHFWKWKSMYRFCYFWNFEYLIFIKTCEDQDRKMIKTG